MKCTCGIYESDPHHKAWHRIVEHNDEVFSYHRRKREEQFDASLRKRQELERKVNKRRMQMVQASQGDHA